MAAAALGSFSCLCLSCPSLHPLWRCRACAEHVCMAPSPLPSLLVFSISGAGLPLLHLGLPTGPAQGETSSCVLVSPSLSSSEPVLFFWPEEKQRTPGQMKAVFPNDGSPRLWCQTDPNSRLNYRLALCPRAGFFTFLCSRLISYKLVSTDFYLMPFERHT